MVLSEAQSGGANLPSTGDLRIQCPAEGTMQSVATSYTYPYQDYPSQPFVKYSSLSPTYHQLSPYRMPARTTAVTVIQSNMPLTTSATSHMKTEVLPNTSCTDRQGLNSLKRSRRCSIGDCNDSDEQTDTKRHRTYSPYSLERQGLHGNTPITPMQGMVDPRSSLFTAAECHLATLQDEDGDTPLHIAVVQSNLPLVEKLIQLIAMSGKSVDIYNTLRQTPLHLAVITNQWQMVRLLVMVGADGNLTDRNGQTSVHLACQRSNMECLHSVTTCSRHPVDLDAKNYEGLTPLHLAVSTGNADVIRFLLSKGADIDCPDGKSGRTALFYAVENEQKDVIEILLEHNADVNAQSYSGNTALHVASGRGFISIVRSLLRHGADMSMKNYHCDTAVTVAKDTSVSKVLYKVYRPEPRVKTPDTSDRKRNLPKQSVTSQHSPCTAIKMEGVETDSCDRSQNVMVGDKIKRIKKERTSSNSSDEGFSSRPSSS